jgi:hypothetical protein
MRLLYVGHWKRIFNRFLATRTHYTKTFLKHHPTVECGCPMCMSPSPQVQMMERLSDRQYDEILQTSLVFTDFGDSSCNNVVVECIMRHTPIMIPNHPAVKEYLGESYPLYFDTVEEIEQKIHNMDLIAEAHYYLQKMDKRQYTIPNFVKSFAKSEIYRQLPVP